MARRQRRRRIWRRPAQRAAAGGGSGRRPGPGPGPLQGPRPLGVEVPAVLPHPPPRAALLRPVPRARPMAALLPRAPRGGGPVGPHRGWGGGLLVGAGRAALERSLAAPTFR